MPTDASSLLLQCAGFLSLIANGAVPALPNTKREAEELLDKIGEFMSASGHLVAERDQDSNG